MTRLFFLFFLLFSVVSFAQEEEEVHSIFFEFDKFNLKTEQADAVVAFVSKIDTARIESVQIFGYCDDRGKDQYNYTLSTNRANTVKDKLIEKGIKSKIIITLEGKGRIMLDEDMQTNIPEARSKNRRVDVVVNFKPIVIEDLKIPGVYSTIKKDRIVGDRIYLDHVLFERGSSQLTYKAKKELDRIALELHKYKNIHFEIQGHVCCTPTFQKEAVDRDTKKRELSINRAKRVYNYFLMKRISKTRMTFKGYGNTQSLKKGSTLDRRVELLITKNDVVPVEAKK
ncbi:MAG: OmpA family protein [Flavobacterium sp.]|jgi:outer membrane protein OmpA-like peptidoglycan-associated protein|uniref:OmpA family protein n=1 Tax=Flavobacterium sp. TaxID=239 RepID=UPI0029713F8C|nr:OmpA family protein [Flavobacterium sp.]TAF11694.1 MAG: OmpA family protein [Flavobacteriia bacterium]WRH72444.1 MAG: OmpA family protein [Flavobacterium sp.]